MHMEEKVTGLVSISLSPSLSRALSYSHEDTPTQAHSHRGKKTVRMETAIRLTETGLVQFDGEVSKRRPVRTTEGERNSQLGDSDTHIHTNTQIQTHTQHSSRHVPEACSRNHAFTPAINTLNRIINELKIKINYLFQYAAVDILDIESF